MITVYSYRWVPDFAQGLVRDLRVRWALEEVGRDYDQWRIGLGEEQNTPAYRACQPYGQVPVYAEGDLVLFESGAIVLHIGETCEVLLPSEPKARARATCWLFSALNTIEPGIQELAAIDLFHAEEAWTRERRPQVEDWVRRRLGELAAWLGDKEYLEGAFTAGDLMMATVLRNLRQTDIVTTDPTLGPYLERCEARPAFQRALADQMASFDAQPS
ncbi:MAG: glutathione S-transferase family protein [Alphaproteobacteria bacterium]|nr:glutathione S-transferase family protein [Alphaproteobacteria bacterium]MBU1515921.1 glutathione S-transferase family protein [Alphaproteobacteria bacterium]MBU2094143.1 glutathione S-transferase family protein [Alphaproteobacteria bacterium]MBU2151495.1 glutathione S-transferase family protein [Alphaproteobacteria bacterium]MBU2305229.1 glutathione S-transferase family protein [Alphaproteobacteria bacterium]